MYKQYDVGEFLQMLTDKQRASLLLTHISQAPSCGLNRFPILFIQMEIQIFIHRNRETSKNRNKMKLITVLLSHFVSNDRVQVNRTVLSSLEKYFRDFLMQTYPMILSSIKHMMHLQPLTKMFTLIVICLRLILKNITVRKSII